MARNKTEKNGWTDHLLPRQTFHEFIWYVLMPLGLVAFVIPMIKLYMFDTSAYRTLCFALFAAAALCALLTMIGSSKRRVYAFIAVQLVAPLAFLAEAVEFSTDLPAMNGSTGTNTVLLLVYFVFSFVIAIHFLRNKRQYFGKEQAQPVNTDPLPPQNIDFIEKWVEGNTAQTAFRVVAADTGVSGALGTKIGGLPYWRPEQSYPADALGNPMRLLLQINFSRDKLADARLPKKGVLQYFISEAAASGNIIGLAGQDDFRVVFQPELDKQLTDSDVALSGAPCTPELPLTFDKVRDRISASDREFDSNIATAVNYNLDSKVTAEEIRIRFPEDQYRELCSRFRSSGSKILGWPDFITEDPRGKYDKNQTLLLQLDTDEFRSVITPGLIFQFLSSPQALSMKEFSKAILQISSKQ